MVSVTVNNLGVAQSGTHWIIFEKEVSGFLLRGVARVTEATYNTATKGDTMDIPSAIDAKINWE